MKIGMVLDNGFFGDLRVENEVMSLREAGFEVSVLCFEHKNKQPPIQQYHGADIIKVYLPLSFKKKMKGLANFIIDPYTRFWSKQISKYIDDHAIDVLHIHDLYLLGAAYKANKKAKRKLPIVADLHENYPAALRYYKFSTTFPGNVLISVPKWERTEKNWVNQADHVITVIEEAQHRYKKLGAKRVHVVANYVNRSEFLGSHKTSKPDANSTSYSALYVGGFDTHRGIEAVVRAIPKIKTKIPEFKLVLVGTGSNENDLKQLAKELDVESSVSFEGWQNPDQLPSYLDASDICLIPHLKTEHTDNTIPHKLFQYMLLKKPVVATNCNPIERIVNETKSGLIYTSNSSEEFADKIIELYTDKTLGTEMGENGFKAVKEKYNWEETAKTLVQLYASIQLPQV